MHLAYILQDTSEAGQDFPSIVSRGAPLPQELVVCCGSIQSQGPGHVATYTMNLFQVGTDGVTAFFPMSYVTK